MVSRGRTSSGLPADTYSMSGETTFGNRVPQVYTSCHSEDGTPVVRRFPAFLTDRRAPGGWCAETANPKLGAISAGDGRHQPMQEREHASADHGATVDVRCVPPGS